MRPRPDYGVDSYRGYGRLTGRVALITGGDSGIGRAVALAFAREGADVAISYLNEDQDAQEIGRAVEKSGRRVLLLPGDIADEKHCKSLVKKTVETFHRLDILVNNAAVQDDAVEGIEDLSDARIRHTFAVNIVAMFNLVRHALPHLMPGSAVINVSSIQGSDPSPAILDYAVTKGAVVTFTKGLSRELIDRGVRVNAVAPGPVWTPLIAQSFKGDKIKNFGDDNPMKRPAQPVELAPAFVFLACDESRFVNGEVLGVTGGRLLP